MSRIFGKLGFIHARLWQQDGLYRAAFLFGPAVLVGILGAGVVRVAVQSFETFTYRPSRWAVPMGQNKNWNSDGGIQVVKPLRSLPTIEANGALSGYVPGWQVTAEPAEVNRAMNVDVIGRPLIAAFRISGPKVDVSQLIGRGVEPQRYVGVGTSLLAIRETGIYALAVRFERPAAPPADCLMRVGFGQRRIVSDLDVDLVQDVSHTYDATQFSLQRGLYPIAWAFGCWHGEQMTAPGQLSLLIRYPGSKTLVPIRSEDLVLPGHQ